MSIVNGTHSVKEAAAIIGITDGRLRQMIRAYEDRSPSRKAQPNGLECRAVKYESPIFPAGYIWQVPDTEVQRLQKVTHTQGRPRKS